MNVDPTQEPRARIVKEEDLTFGPGEFETFNYVPNVGLEGKSRSEWVDVETE